METRSSHVLVGTVAIVLLAALFAFVLWLARFSGQERQEFDIFFKQSVSGLAVGSAVSFQGVPVGQVQRIALMPQSPEFVRVRIAVENDVPILQGTTAAIEGVGFTGVSQIQLDGAIRGAAAITEAGPFGVPVIPTRPGAFGQLLASAPQLLDRVTTLVGRLNTVLDERNQQSISGILANADRLSDSLADRGPEIAATLVEARQTLAAATRAADQLAATAGSADRLLNQEGQPLVRDLRATIERANGTIARIDRLTQAAEPGITAFSTQTAPEVGALVRDLRDATQRLGAIAAKLDEDPAGALVGGRRLPSYDPEKK